MGSRHKSNIRSLAHGLPAGYAETAGSLSRTGEKGLVPAPEGRPAAGRNDPCPCGSGRRYKACCLRRHDGTGTSH